MLAKTDTAFWSKVLSNMKKDVLSRRVCDYIVGSKYSAVKLCNGYIGIAYSYAQEDKCTPNTAHKASLADFIEGLSSDCIVERALSQAAMNALGQEYISETRETTLHGSIEEEVASTLERGALVVFAGSVKKLPEYYKARGFKVIVTDRNPYSRGVLPDYYLYKYLPGANAVYLTGAAFSRPDIDHILSLAVNADYIVSVGPSLSIPSAYLGGTGLTHLATSLIVNTDAVFRLAKLGYGYHSMREYLKHIHLKIDEA